MKCAVGLTVVLVVSGLCPAGEDGAEPRNKLDDRAFVKRASAINLAEIDFGNLASRRASTDAVKRYARHLVDDFTKANAQLVRLAGRTNLPVSVAMDPRQQEAFQRVSQLEGRDFDRMFLEALVKAHRETIVLFDTQARVGKEEALRAFAANHLAVLRLHLKTAQGVLDQLRDGRAAPKLQPRR